VCIQTTFFFSQVVLQGILGASIGQKLLDTVGVKDDVARGVAIGT
jgi:putative effector of murein hydrolase